MAADNKRWSLALGIFGVCLITGFTVLLLDADGQWALLSLLVGALLVAYIAARSGVAARIEDAFSSHCRFMSWTIVLAFLVVLAVFCQDPFSLLLLATLLLYFVVCLGLNIQLGYCGVINFAGAAFFGVGSYTAAVMTTHTQWPHLVVLLSGGVMASLVGALLLLPVLRTRGHYAALVTIAFGILSRTFIEVNQTLGGAQGLKVPGVQIFGWSLNDNIDIGDLSISSYVSYAVFAFILAALALIITKRLERSWIGLNFDAVRIDETAAATFGINIARWKITAFTIGNFFAGVAGALFAMMTGFVAPSNFTFSDSLILISIVMLGGIGNAWGILPAAAIVLLVPEKLQAIQEYRFLLYAIVIILILLFRPQGLFPRRVRNYFSRQVEK